MATCPYGKASLVFPLTIPARTGLGIVAAAESMSKAAVEANVVGYTTSKVRGAGAHSLRLAFSNGSLDIAPGNYAAALRVKGYSGWFAGLANTHHSDAQLSLEVIVMGRPDKKLKDLMYLPDTTIQALWPEGQATAEVRVLEPLLLEQVADCPEPWLRDRLLKLADMLSKDVRFNASGDLLASLQSAGLQMIAGPTKSVGAADSGDRVDRMELGYWQEEMDVGHRCDGGMNGGRLDVPYRFQNPDDAKIISKL